MNARISSDKYVVIDFWSTFVFADSHGTATCTAVRPKPVIGKNFLIFQSYSRHSQQKSFPTLFSMNRICSDQKANNMWKFWWHETRWNYLEVAVTSCQKYHTLVDFQKISESESADRLTSVWRITKGLSKMSTANDLCRHLIKLVTEWTAYFAYELAKEL